MKRLFIALPVPESLSRVLRESVRPFLESLDRRDIPYRVPPFGNDHLTLAFLGASDEAAEQRAIESMHTVHATGFRLHWSSLDAFPNARSARVAFAGFKPEARLIDLHRQLDGALRAADFALEDRPFVPHLTIARLGRPAKLDCALETDWIQPPPIPVERVVLYESRPGAGGSKYLEIASVPLSAED